MINHVKLNFKLLLLFISCDCSQKCQLMVFHFSLSNCKYPLVSRTPLMFLAYLNNTAVSILPLISK